jgi:hypothetical protein
VNITGLDANGVSDGRVIVLINVGANDIVLKDSDGGSQAENQFQFPAAAGDVTLETDGSATLMYDATSQRWRLLSTN